MGRQWSPTLPTTRGHRWPAVTTPRKTTGWRESSSICAVRRGRGRTPLGPRPKSPSTYLRGTGASDHLEWGPCPRTSGRQQPSIPHLPSRKRPNEDAYVSPTKYFPCVIEKWLL